MNASVFKWNFAYISCIKSDISIKEEEEGWKMAESGFVPSINEGTEKFKSVWMTRDEKDNFSQKHDAELIKEEKRKEVEEEIRIQVDELMRAELKNLKAVYIFLSGSGSG
jgi:hypothetical protein